jgi:hypothetical protein
MIRCLLLLLFFPAMVGAQKVARATKFLEEGKYEKSTELYRDLLEKDTADVAASFGYVLSIIRQAESPQFAVSEFDLERYYHMIKLAEKNYSSLTMSDKAFVSSSILKTLKPSELLKWISESMWLLYTNKITSPTALEKYQRNYYFNNQFISSSDLSAKVEKLYYDSLAVLNTKLGWLMFVNKFPRGMYLQEAKKSIAKIDFNAAMKSEGTAQIKAFIVDYPNDFYTSQAKAELEKREYLEVEASPTENNLELYLKKYPATQYKTVIQEKLATFYFEGIASSQSLSSIEFVIQKLNAFTSTADIKGITDRVRLIAFKVEYTKVKEVDDLDLLNAFIKKYSYLKNIEIEEIRKKYYTLWNQKLNEDGLAAAILSVKRFIKEYESNSDSSFFMLGDKVVGALNEYISSKKEDIVENVLRNRIFASVSTEKVKEAVRIIAPLIKFDLQLTSQLVMERIKTYRGNAKTIADLSDELIKKMTANELFLGTEGNEQGLIFSINRVGENAKINTRTFIWNGVNYGPVELGTKDAIFGIIGTRYGVVNFSKPFFTGEVEGEREFIVRLYGYKKTDQMNFPGFQIDMYYKMQNNKWIADRARSISNHYSSVSVISDVNRMYNFASELELALSGQQLIKE